MSFIILSDYQLQIKTDLLNILTEGSEATRIDAELAALDEMSGHLRGRYDLAACFPDVLTYSLAEQYEAGSIVVVPGTPAVPGAPGSPGTPATMQLIYVANRDTVPGEQPSPATAGKAAGPTGPAWRVSDPRAKLLKMYLVDMAIYHLHARQNPQSIPQLRLDRYDTAEAWCKACRTGKVSPGLPLLSDTSADGTPNVVSIRPRGGSGAPKLQNSY